MRIILFSFSRKLTSKDFARIRKSAGLTQTDLAAQLSVSKPTIAKWEDPNGNGVKLSLSQYEKFMIATSKPEEFKQLSELMEAQASWWDQKIADSKD